MSGRATDHRATALSGYCPIGLLSCRVTVSRANVRSGYCPSGMCPWGSVRQANVPSGYCSGTVPVFKSTLKFRQKMNHK